ncbi:MAG TPA: gliding motility-associated protein GldE [Chitinophagales bacterium]|nr:gliding motility-associated protein GldE [Chitinophagales bacterium]HNB48082.1 gliding motility-associated protein GldE [Chitinophagales bacterium]
MDDGIPIPFLLQAILGTSTSEVFNTFNATVAIELLFTLILLIFTAMMCAVEVAIFLFTTQEINELERSNDETDAIILDFIKKPRRFLATFVLTTTLFTLAVVLMFENVLETILKHEFIEANSSLLLIIKILFETFIIVLFAEVIPKLYATQQYYKVAKNTVHLLRIFDILFSPFVRALLATSNFFEKRLAGFSNNVTAKDIDEAIDITTSQENDEAIRNDSRILKGIVKFGNIVVTQIMHSRMDVVAVDKNANFEELLSIVRESGYSRIPVVEENFDKVAGIIYIKDLLRYIDAPKDFNWQQLIKPAMFVPESKKIDDLLEDFQAKRVHMAIVVDEYGGSSGIVTLEDVLEEVIGDIKDEFDDASEIDFKKIDNYNYIFEGRTALNDVCKVLEVPTTTFDDARGDADSLAGLVLELNAEIPVEGDVLTFKHFTFLILEADKTRVIRVKVTIAN